MVLVMADHFIDSIDRVIRSDGSGVDLPFCLTVASERMTRREWRVPVLDGKLIKSHYWNRDETRAERHCGQVPEIPPDVSGY